jgi:hypothetical protein
MGLLVVALVTVVAVLGMVLFAVHKIRPRSLRFKAHVTRWLSVSLEIDSRSASGGDAPAGTSIGYEFAGVAALCVQALLVLLWHAASKRRGWPWIRSRQRRRI